MFTTIAGKPNGRRLAYKKTGSLCEVSILEEKPMRAKEADILSVIREMERSDRVGQKTNAGVSEKAEGLAEADIPDPKLLRESLEKKLKFINLLDGYADKTAIKDITDITTMKARVEGLLAELDDIIERTGP